MWNKKGLLLWLCVVCVPHSVVSFCSRQQYLPPNYEESLIRLQESAKLKREEKKEQRAVWREKCRSVHTAKQKNRLTYFASQDGYIRFDDDADKNTYFLSNFYPVRLCLWHMKFSCAEAALQAARFLDRPEVAARFTRLNGEEAWRLGQKLGYQQRADWYKVRENLMLEVLRAKFGQHPKLEELLVATGDAYLVDTSSRDIFWASGREGNGRNRLGYLLMQLREEDGGVGVVSKPGI